MSNPALEILIPGRVVCGHPMTRRPVKKKQNGSQIETPVIRADGTPATDVYIALAIPKTGEADWKLTAWGQQVNVRATQDWPGGEHGAPTFSWKITDGDSAVPNKKGKKPCDREGWPGHWVLHCTTQLNVRCHHVGKYDPTEQIQVENEIKCGDYARVLVGFKGNGPSESPGIYANPVLFELSRAGAVIVSESGPAAADVFGGGAATTPATPATTVTAATDFLDGPGGPAAPDGPAAPAAPQKYKTPDGEWTEAQLVAAGFSAEQVAALPKV